MKTCMRIGTEVSQFCLMDLPTAVLHEILFGLPINSIMELKFVCRALYKLVSDRDFSVNYSKKSPFSTFLIPVDLVQLSTLYLVQISDNRDYIRTMFKPKVPDWSERDSTMSVVGTCCNGLVCVALHKSLTRIVYICNPITGECIAVAEHKINKGQLDVEFGFGFCRSTNNYKILKIVSNSSNANSWDAPVIREGGILTVGVDDTWRGLDCVANPTIPFSFALSNSVNLNDVLHWLVMGNGSTWISTFDFEVEKIGRLSHPRGLVLDLHRMHMTSINNQLCLVDTSDLCKIVVWKMKKYAVAESWTKDMVYIPVSSEVQLRELYLVRILENGDMLFSRPWKSYSISYNPTTRELTKIEVPFFGSIDYSPSFLSLKEVVKRGLSSTTDVLTK